MSLRAFLVILKQGITLLIDMVEYHVFQEAEQALSGLSRYGIREGVTLLPPLSGA